MSVSNSRSKLPWFAFYPSEFLSSTIDMDPACVGAYIRLLCHQWLTGFIPSDPLIIGRICGGFDTAWWDRIRPRLIEVPGGLAHPRLMAERQRADEVSAKRRANIARVNNRSIHRAIECTIDRAIECPTPTTTVTYPPPGGGGGDLPVTDQALGAIARRERKTEEQTLEIVEAVRRVFSRRMDAAGASDASRATAWLAVIDRWSTTGHRPTDYIKELTDNLSGAKDIDKVIQYRANRQTSKRSRMA